MKAFLFAVVFAGVVAVGAAFVLQGTFQEPSSSAYATEGARVGDPGTNLIAY